jgi:hypothetical protein
VHAKCSSPRAPTCTIHRQILNDGQNEENTNWTGVSRTPSKVESVAARGQDKQTTERQKSKIIKPHMTSPYANVPRIYKLEKRDEVGTCCILSRIIRSHGGCFARCHSPPSLRWWGTILGREGGTTNHTGSIALHVGTINGRISRRTVREYVEPTGSSACGPYRLFQMPPECHQR